MSKKKLTKLSIVFEETPGDTFQVYVDGATRDLMDVPEEEMTGAEYWCTRVFSLVGDLLEKSKSLTNVSTNPRAPGRKH